LIVVKADDDGIVSAVEFRNGREKNALYERPPTLFIVFHKGLHELDLCINKDGFARDALDNKRAAILTPDLWPLTVEAHCRLVVSIAPAVFKESKRFIAARTGGLCV